MWFDALGFAPPFEIKTKFVYYSVCSLLFLYVLFIILFPVRRSAVARHARVGKLYTPISVYVIIIWIMYTVVWSLGDGFRVINIDKEIILFAIVLFFSLNVALILGRSSG
jgi:bacteriorhodopsin